MQLGSASIQHLQRYQEGTYAFMLRIVTENVTSFEFESKRQILNTSLLILVVMFSILYCKNRLLISQNHRHYQFEKLLRNCNDPKILNALEYRWKEYFFCAKLCPFPYMNSQYLIIWVSFKQSNTRVVEVADPSATFIFLQ